MKQFKFMMVFLFTVMASGCAWLAEQQVPSTPREMLVASYLAVETAAQETKKFHEMGLITDGRKELNKEELRKALVYLAAAEQAIVLETGTEKGFVAEAIAILTPIQAMLAEIALKEKEKANEQ